ncbi:MAG TPA: ABC transporter permease subunit [Candidatus Saccharimonadales bacterium]|nr:ABC transporter permease subunit [Candidatus Saccharimonadales bacterium]
MFRYITRRFLETIPVLWIIATVTFFMMRLAPGGPFDAEKQISPEVRARMEAHYGLDKPLFEQYLTQMKHLLHGDLGPSFKYPGRTVNEIIADAFPVSLELGFEALAVALVFGLAAGMVASLKQNSAWDHVPMSLAMAGLCVPTFVMGPLLISAFALHLDWFNAAGWYFPRDRVLPALTLGAYYAAYIARLARGGLLEILNQDFIRTARAKGASMRRILFKHALRGGILPVISFLGPAVAGLLTGSFVVETIFGVPGLGRYFVTAAFNRDYFMVMGSVLFYAGFVVALNLAVDVLLVWMNPKLRFE